MRILKQFMLLLVLFGLYGCSGHPPMKTVERVDLERFMGDWYVIASIPTIFEKDIYNAIERYDRIAEDRIQTTFSFYKQGEAEKQVLTPVGYVEDDGSNALWGMQFIWPFKADFRIVYLDENYRVTVIGRQKRDYVWIMAREPQMNDHRYGEIVAFVASLGYDTSKLVRVPQNWQKPQ